MGYFRLQELDILNNVSNHCTQNCKQLSIFKNENKKKLEVTLM